MNVVGALGVLGLLAACDAGADSEPMPEIVAVEAPEPEPVVFCDNPPASGTKLARDTSKGTGVHTVAIVNGGASNTIVNVRDGATNEVVVSFYVAESERGEVNDLPDGKYKIQYAGGYDLGEDCKQFAPILSASEDPEIVDFPAGSQMTLTYELTPRVDGNFTGESIDPSEFAAE